MCNNNNNFICFVFICASIINCVSSETALKNTQVDLIIHGLEDQQWTQDETQCMQDMFNILNNVKNHTLWAVWIWNSMQQPTGIFYGSRYSLGNYDQCLEAPSVAGEPNLLTQYCLVDIKLTDKIDKREDKYDMFGATDEFLKVKSKVGRSFNVISWGTCLPASCNTRAVIKIVKSIYLLNPLASTDPNITVDNCQVAGEKTIYSTQFYVFILVMASIIVGAMLSSVYLHNNAEDTTLTRVACAFSLQKNWSSLTRTSDNEIAFVNFTKTIQTIIVNCSHSFIFTFTGAVGNLVYFDEYLTEKPYILGNLIHHVDLILLENFIILSGLLIMRSLMEKKVNPIISLLQRYTRLIGSFAFLIFYTIAVSKYTGDGPLWNKLAGRECKACEESWVWSLLMLNNYINNDKICQVVAWYVPCDYQLAIIGSALFCIWQWNKRAGKITTILAIILALVLPGVMTYWKRLPGLLLYDADGHSVIRSNEVYLQAHMKSHFRLGPYLIGMATGYLLTVYRPAKYRGVISKEWSYIGFIVAGVLGLKVWTSAAAWCLGEYNAWNTAVYVSFNSNIWAATTCLSVIIAEYGNISALQSIFAWPGFAITSRLGYGVYISHSLILERYIFTQRSPMHFDMIGLITLGLGYLAVSLVCAVLLWLFVEAPLSNLTKLIVTPNCKPRVNGDKYENNYNRHTAIYDDTMKNGKHV